MNNKMNNRKEHLNYAGPRMDGSYETLQNNQFFSKEKYIKDTMKSAEAGDPCAQFAVANIYLYGLDGFEQDFEKGMHWLNLSVEQEHEFSIALNKHIQYIIEHSDTNAMKEYGNIRGSYFKNISEQMVVSMIDLAEKGNIDAIIFLGKEWMENPKLDFRDKYSIAFHKYLEPLAHNGHAYAQNLLGQIYEGYLDLDSAKYYYEEAAKNGDADACLRIAKRYFMGIENCPEDMNFAYDIFEKAAKMGFFPAMGILMDIALDLEGDGQEVRDKINRAYEWQRNLYDIQYAFSTGGNGSMMNRNNVYPLN